SEAKSGKSVPAFRFAPCGLHVPLAAIARARILLDHRDRVGAGKPAIEVDVGAALRAERAEAVQRRLAADRAALRRARRRLIHGRDVGLMAVKWKPSAFTVPTRRDRATFAPAVGSYNGFNNGC